MHKQRKQRRPPKATSTIDASLADIYQPTLPANARTPSHRSMHRAPTSGGHRIAEIGIARPQAKLTVGAPNDAYEQEADQVARQVMTMADAQLARQPEEEEEEIQAKPVAHLITPLVQRQDEGADEEEEDLAQLSAAPGTKPRVSADMEGRIDGLQGSGQPLPDAERAFFEPRFGTDFRSVRLHTGDEVGEMATELGARAFTTGQDIFFNQGEYTPGNMNGRELLAHELTHVVQQNSGEVVQRQGGPAEAAGLAISAAAFAVTLLPGSTEGMTRQEVVTSRSREEAASSGTRITIPILQLYAHISAGTSDAIWNLVLETDGDSILSANTEFAEINGFEGGVFGSTGRVTWGATPLGGSRERPVKILLTVDGFLNPSGWGYTDFNASYIISGDGTVERRHCKVSNVSGNLAYTFNWTEWGNGYSIQTMSDTRSEELNERRKRGG